MDEGVVRSTVPKRMYCTRNRTRGMAFTNTTNRTICDKPRTIHRLHRENQRTQHKKRAATHHKLLHQHETKRQLLKSSRHVGELPQMSLGGNG